MTQANGCSIPQNPINQLIDEEILHTLQGISGALDFLANGCKDLSGPPLWNALTYLAQQLADTIDAIEARAELIERRARQARRARRGADDVSRTVEAVLDTFWIGFDGWLDNKAITENPWSRERCPALHVAWVKGWEAAEDQETRPAAL